MTHAITRLAPSPTGALHLGNARTFVLNHLLAVTNGWAVRLRIEDLDGPRVKAGADKALLDELAWLGLHWEGPVVYQSQRGAVYRQAIEALARAGHAYACVCSRRDIETAAGAPHREDGAGAYAGACRGRFHSAEQARAQTGRPAAWRLMAPDKPIEFHDRFAGPQCFDLRSLGGDFVIAKNDGLAAYQLAVVMDDAAAGVNRIVRGDDLLDSAARQIHLRRLLQIGPEPEYWHLPLVIGPDGRRLAKRHGDTRLAHYRHRGATPSRVLGLLGYWSGLLERRQETSLDDLARRFDLARLSHAPVTFTPEDDAFLAG